MICLWISACNGGDLFHVEVYKNMIILPEWTLPACADRE